MSASKTPPKRDRNGRVKCPDCGARTRTKHDGIFRWKFCPKCGWDVFKG